MDIKSAHNHQHQTPKMKFKIQQPIFTRTSSIEVNINDYHQEFIAPLEPTCPPEFSRLLYEAGKALKKQSPTLADEGIGGAFFFHDENSKIVGVFKPSDQDPLSKNNPKGYDSPAIRRLKDSFLSGTTSVRECAAYLLDYDNFSGVPPTELVLCHHPALAATEGAPNEPKGQPVVVPHPSNEDSCPGEIQHELKIGSFQEFKANDGSLEEIGTSNLPDEEVHKIAVLDIRIANKDRHEGNILFTEEIDDKTGNPKGVTLIPIDHAFSFPSDLSDIHFCWQNWPQAKRELSEKTKTYINNLDVERDIQLLESKFPKAFEQQHFTVMRIMNLLLKRGVAHNVTFYQLGEIISPDRSHQSSQLEMLVAQAKREATSDKQFYDILQRLLDNVLFEKELTASSGLQDD